MESGLNNQGERIAVVMPQPPELDGTVYYAVADEVQYSDQSPWPPAAGKGQALGRVSASGYGNDVINWRAAPPLVVVGSRTYLPFTQNAK